MNTSVEPSPTYTEETECPITLEEYAESGDQQPVRLPQCGHSYSRAGVSMLLRGSQQAQGNAKGGRARTCPIQCPTCRTISRLKGIGDCKVDLRIIESIRRRAAETASKKFRFQDRIADQAGGVSSDSSDCTHGQLGSCNAGVQRLQECDVPDIVKKRYAEGMTEGERHEKRQLLFAEVYRWLHVVVKHLVRDEDVGDTCHTLTDYILTNITPFVLDFLTSPIVAFEVIRSIWASFEHDMFDMADAIGDAALKFHIYALNDMPPELLQPASGDSWTAHKRRLRMYLIRLLLICCQGLFPAVPPSTLKHAATIIIDEGLARASAAERWSHGLLQPQHFCSLAASGIRATIATGKLPLRGLFPNETIPVLTPIIDGMTDKATALLTPVYGDEAAARIARHAAALICNHAADWDSALILMHGGSDFSIVVEAAVDALAQTGELDGEPTVPPWSPYACRTVPPLLEPPPQHPSQVGRSVRSLVDYVRSFCSKKLQFRDEHSGRGCPPPGLSFPPATSSRHHAPAVPSAYGSAGDGGQTSISDPRQCQPATTTAPAGARISITPEDLFSRAAQAGRASVEDNQGSAAAGPSASAYHMPPPSPIHNRGSIPMHIPAPSASARAAVDGIRVEDLPDTANYVPVDEASGTQMVLPERRGQPVCAHFQKHGWCELGMHCALGHPSGRSVRFNLLGYPIRPGQRVCKFFMEHARCKFGKNCRYNHPNIAYMHGPLAGSTVTTIPPPTPLPPALRQKKGQA